MPRYKPVDRNPRFLAVVLDEQIQPGKFEFALNLLVDHELDLSALDARFNNDETGASAYDPRVMLKIVLLAYSRGLTSSRPIERACAQNVQFMAISGDAQPSYTHIAKFVRELGEQIQPLFAQVLLTCDRLGLIGGQMFAIDGVKLPANASNCPTGGRGRRTWAPSGAPCGLGLRTGAPSDARPSTPPSRSGTAAARPQAPAAWRAARLALPERLCRLHPRHAGQTRSLPDRCQESQ
jgi:transposase